MWIDEIKSELTDHILPFWMKLKDEKYGGFYGYMNYGLQKDETAEKGCILNSRITWFFANAYLHTGQPEALECTMHGYRYLREHCVDAVYGGVYWSTDAYGNPLDTTKHTYNQAFAIYALCAYYEATEDEDALLLAMDLFRLIEARCTDDFGYLEAFTRSFEPESNEKLSENGVMADKTMNTLLHVLEAYTQLYKLTENQGVYDCLVRILDILEHYVYNREKCRQEVFFDREYHSILDLHSYGHDIETAWLVDRTLDILQDDALTERIAPITKTLAYQILQVAFDGHSLANECECGVVNTHRIWWVQAEAVVGFVNAWQRTGDEAFITAAKAQWEFIRDKVSDKRKDSEWFWEVEQDGTPIEGRPIVEPWKCPYHNGRMCFEIMDRLENR